MADKIISDYSLAGSIDGANDLFLMEQDSTGSYKSITRNIIMGVTGDPADISSAQVFTNKTIGNTNTVTLKDTLFTLQDDSDTTKQARFQLSGITTATTRTYTLPNASSTLADIATAQTFTNKTLTSPVITGGSITNTTISVDSISEFTSANGVTVDGMNIKDGKLNTNNSVVTANITDSAVTPAKLLTGTGSTWSWGNWSPSYTNFTLGNGTLNYAKYNQSGKSVFFEISVTLGSSSSVSGQIIFTLPVTASSSPAINGTAVTSNVQFVDLGSAVHMGVFIINGSGNGALSYLNVVSSSLRYQTISSSAPFTWAAGDIWSVSGIYEAA